MERKYLIIPKFERLGQSAELAQAYDAGFEYNDFCNPDVYSDEAEIKKRCDTYKGLKRDRSMDTLHGAFLDIVVTSQDPQIAGYSQMRAEQSLAIAEKLGVRGVVFHTGLIAELQVDYYLDAWLSKSECFWRKMAERYPEIDIYIENTFERTPEMLIRLKKNLADVTNFKLCLDYGHACLTPTTIENWIEQMGQYTGHIHLNDNDYKVDLHQVPGEGLLDFLQCKQLLEQHLKDVPILLELTGLERQKRALEFMRKL